MLKLIFTWKITYNNNHYINLGYQHSQCEYSARSKAAKKHSLDIDDLKAVRVEINMSDFKKMEIRPGSFQTLLTFGDKYELSIISGAGSYSSIAAPYEIAVWSKGKFIQVPGISEPDQDVRGHLTENDVDSIIRILFSLTKELPVQI